MPSFVVLVLCEKMYGHWKGNDTAPWRDSISSLCSGMTNVIKDVLGLSISLITYELMVEHLAIFTIQNTVLVYIIAFIVIDFYGYWSHRVRHKINMFWNNHVIHHSSEEFNLACALRQTISSFADIFTFLLIPAALVGVPATVIAIVLPLQLFLQFWYHTRHIKSMGWLELIIVTPSHHRVHHAINKEYLDKNLGQIFIFWDMLFGTFQKELEDVEAVYGITRPAKTWNPIKINFQHAWLLIKDAWRAPKIWDKLRIWFMPTGWRPEGFEELYPVPKISNVYDFNKYRSAPSGVLTTYSAFQLLIGMLLITHFFYAISSINDDFGFWALLLYGGYLFLLVYCLTDLMDTNRYTWIFELLRTAYALFVVYFIGGWFGLDPLFTWSILIYQLVSLFVSIGFVAHFSRISAQ